MSDINNNNTTETDTEVNAEVDTEINCSILSVPQCNMCFKYKKLNQYLNECDDKGAINIKTLYAILGETIVNEDCKDFLRMLGEILQNYNCDM